MERRKFLCKNEYCSSYWSGRVFGKAWKRWVSSLFLFILILMNILVKSDFLVCTKKNHLSLDASIFRSHPPKTPSWRKKEKKIEKGEKRRKNIKQIWRFFGIHKTPLHQLFCKSVRHESSERKKREKYRKEAEQKSAQFFFIDTF